MRNLVVHLPQGRGQAAATLARQHGALEVAIWSARSDDQPVEIVSIQIRNASVEAVLKALPEFDPLSVTLDPHEVLHFTPPLSETSQALKELERRSPVEVFLLGLQSVSSWRSFSIYAIAGAIIVWIALYTNSIYLLIAAMLVSPFAGPAMNVGLATATGDRHLFSKNLQRYLAAIFFTMGITALLTLIFNQRFITDLMATVGHISQVAILLPLAAGVAGSFNLIQSERSSLVSSTAVGMLITASLAPPAGLLGMVLVMQNWDMAVNTIFILGMQLLGLNLAGSIIFRLFGLTPELMRYQRGKQWLFYASGIITILGLAGMLAWQFSGSIRMQRISEETQLTQLTLETIRDDARTLPIEVEATFYSTEAYGENTLLVNVYAQRALGVELSRDVLAEEIQQSILNKIQETNREITPFVNVVIFEPPPNITND